MIDITGDIGLLLAQLSYRNLHLQSASHGAHIDDRPQVQSLTLPEGSPSYPHLRYCLMTRT